jgi:hypothetical protein
VFTEGGVSGHDGSSGNPKSDQIRCPDTFPWNWRMAGNRVVTGFLRLVQMVSKITRKWSKLKSEFVGQGVNMSVPKYDELMKPLLLAVQDGGVYKIKDVTATLAQQFNLSTEDMAEMLPSGRQCSKTE